MSQSRNRIIDLLKEMYSNLPEDNEMYKDSDTFYEMALDSLDMIEFTMRLEKEFDISFDDSRLEETKTLGQMVKYVDELID